MSAQSWRGKERHTDKASVAAAAVAWTALTFVPVEGLEQLRTRRVGHPHLDAAVRRAAIQHSAGRVHGQLGVEAAAQTWTVSDDMHRQQAEERSSSSASQPHMASVTDSTDSATESLPVRYLCVG